MTILELKKYFKEELSNIYTESEALVLSTIFLEKITGFNTQQIRRFIHQEVLETDLLRLKSVLSQLKTGMPYQQILGEADFYGKTFKMSPEVLIPRPETEELIEIAIDKLQNSDMHQAKKEFRILDIGTGSGIIPIILKNRFPDAEVCAIDISEKSLDIARQNAAIHQTAVHFEKLDFLSDPLPGIWDAIISNPPYIAQDEKHTISDTVKRFEPLHALFSPVADPLIFYRKIAEYAEKHLAANGMIFLEINQKFGAETLALFEAFGSRRLIRDLSDNDRFVFVEKL